MPIQKFPPMSKNFPSFDCDAHVVEPALIWERAGEYLTRDELAALKTTMWYDSDTNQMTVNDTLGAGQRSERRGGTRGRLNLLTVAGPGLKHPIQRALNVRNLKPETALTRDQSDYLDHHGASDPKARLKDMNVQGIDQVMCIPSDVDTYPWLINGNGAAAMCKAYNEWAYDYCQEDPERLFFAALIPLQDTKSAVREVYRVASKGCRVGLIRPVDAMGNYPLQPKFDPLWKAMEETGMVYGMHPFPAFGALKPPGYTEQYSASELINRTIGSAGIPHSFLTNVQNFQSEAALWVVAALFSGLFERFPKLNAAVFEASSTWLSFVLDDCDKYYKLYKNERAMRPLKNLPSETFGQHCVTGFEGDEAPPSRMPEFYEDILVWSSDVYHHDGDDVWRALETMHKCNLDESYQAKFLGENARRAYNIEAPKKFITERVTEIERPDWWPTQAEIDIAMTPEAGMKNRNLDQAIGEVKS
ncbi:MAG: amidohydrolase [Pseudomonadales bacterium]|nr:amidohydrolase [Pseudomonadales bacterium]